MDKMDRHTMNDDMEPDSNNLADDRASDWVNDGMNDGMNEGTDDLADDGTTKSGLRLDERDVAALDALIEAEMDLLRVSPALRERAQHIASLLGLLQPPHVGDADALVDVTLARVSRARLDDAAQLTPADESALQAWVLAGFNAKKTPGVLRQRAQQLEAMQHQITTVPLGDASALIEKTLARIEADENAKAQRMNFETQAFRRGLGVRLADVVSVAAVLLVGAAVMWPLLTTLRQQSQRTACFGNLNAAGLGFSTYAGDNRDQLPVASTTLSGPWWNTGTPNQSNSANLYQMVRTGYAQLDDLACPGNPDAPHGEADPGASDWASRQNVSYSYQIMFGPAMATWSGRADHGPQVVIADRSPVVDVWVQGKPFFPMTNSKNHNGRGQHALMSDGSAAWLTTPETASGDNIWLPRAIEQAIERLAGRDRNRLQTPLTGTETVESARDVFLGP